MKSNDKLNFVVNDKINEINDDVKMKSNDKFNVDVNEKINHHVKMTISMPMSMIKPRSMIMSR